MTRTFSCTGQFFASFPLCLDISLLGILCVYCYYGFHLWNSLLQPSGRYLGAFCSKQCRAKQMACDVFRDFSRQKANVKKGRTSKDEGLDRISSSPSSSSSSSCFYIWFWIWWWFGVQCRWMCATIKPFASFFKGNWLTTLTSLHRHIIICRSNFLFGYLGFSFFSLLCITNLMYKCVF